MEFFFEVATRTKELASSGRYPTDPALYWVALGVCKFHLDHIEPSEAADKSDGSDALDDGEKRKSKKNQVCSSCSFKNTLPSYTANWTFEEFQATR